MVLPLLAAAAPALIGGAANIFSGIMGSNAQSEANEQNYQIALMNYYQRERERSDAIQEARRQEKEGKLGSTDAEGNRTYWDPTRGWVTEKSEKTEEMSRLQDAELRAQLIKDLPAKRQKMFENIARQRKEGGYADAIMEAMARQYREDPEAGINRRNRMSVEGINEGIEGVTRSAMQNMTRTNPGGAGKVAAELAKEKGSQLRKAFMENQESGRGESENKYMSTLQNLGQLYNTFATQAKGMPAADFNFQNLAGTANDTGARSQAAGQQLSGNLLNAIGRSGGSMDYKADPEYGPANTVQTLGNTLMGAFERNKASGRYSSASSDYDDYSRGYDPRSNYQSNRGPWDR